MTLLEQITSDKFGDDAERLLKTRSIIPLINPAKPKAPIGGWTQGFDPKIDIKFHSLAVLTGPKSGITVWDIDSNQLTPPVAPNVKTSKGLHVYSAHAGERRIIRVADNVDLLGSNGVAIFYSDDREFRHPHLADPVEMTSWLNLSPISLLQGSHEGRNEGKEKGKNEGYYSWLHDQGYELDIEVIKRGHLALMQQASEGHRNNTLYRLARESHRCGIDVTALEDAAHEGGLDWDEIRSTTSSAEADIAMGMSRSVYDNATTWKDTVAGVVPDYALPVVEALARRAIEVNDHSPFFPQDKIVEYLAAQGIERQQPAVSKTLTALAQKHEVIQIIHLGYQPSGWLNPRAYRLCLDGQPISEILR